MRLPPAPHVMVVSAVIAFCGEKSYVVDAAPILGMREAKPNLLFSTLSVTRGVIGVKLTNLSPCYSVRCRPVSLDWNEKHYTPVEIGMSGSRRSGDRTRACESSAPLAVCERASSPSHSCLRPGTVTIPGSWRTESSPKPPYPQYPAPNTAAISQYAGLMVDFLSGRGLLQTSRPSSGRRCD